MSLLDDISKSIQDGDELKVTELIQKALGESICPETILREGLLAGIALVGEQFRENEVFVPEVLIAARAMNAGISVLKPLLMEQGMQGKGVAVIGTVKGDIHDIGKNLLKVMLEGKGLTVIDLGIEVSAESFIDEAIRSDASVVCCSALLSTAMNEMKKVVELAKTKGVRDNFKIMVGGAPVTQRFCDSIGADYYSADATTAAEAALAFCAQR